MRVHDGQTVQAANALAYLHPYPYSLLGMVHLLDLCPRIPLVSHTVLEVVPPKTTTSAATTTRNAPTKIKITHEGRRGMTASHVHVGTINVSVLFLAVVLVVVPVMVHASDLLPGVPLATDAALEVVPRIPVPAIMSSVVVSGVRVVGIAVVPVVCAVGTVLVLLLLSMVRLLNFLPGHARAAAALEFVPRILCSWAIGVRIELWL